MQVILEPLAWVSNYMLYFDIIVLNHPLFRNNANLVYPLFHVSKRGPFRLEVTSCQIYGFTGKYVTFSLVWVLKKLCTTFQNFSTRNATYWRLVRKVYRETKFHTVRLDNLHAFPIVVQNFDVFFLYSYEAFFSYCQMIHVASSQVQKYRDLKYLIPLFVV